jgi:hypothetical protein
MDGLDQYLTGQYHVDKTDIEEIETYIIDSAQTLVDAFDKDRGMPYTIRKDTGPYFGESSPGKKNFSESTTAMVTLAIAKIAWPLC